MGDKRSKEELQLVLLHALLYKESISYTWLMFNLVEYLIELIDMNDLNFSMINKINGDLKKEIMMYIAPRIFTKLCTEEITKEEEKNNLWETK